MYISLMECSVNKLIFDLSCGMATVYLDSHTHDMRGCIKYCKQIDNDVSYIEIYRNDKLDIIYQRANDAWEGYRNDNIFISRIKTKIIDQK